MTPRKRQPTFKEKLIEKVVSGINFNTIIITIAGSYFTVMGAKLDHKQDQQFDKVDSATTKMYDWRKGRETKDSIINAKLDLLINTKTKTK